MVPAGVITAAGLMSLRDKFAELVDSNMHLMDSVGTVTRARLVELDEGPKDPDLEQFSIVLEGDGLTEGLYKVYHPNTGTLRIGLLASGEPGSGAVRQRAYFSKFV